MNFSRFGKLFVSRLVAGLDPLANTTPEKPKKKRGRPAGSGKKQTTQTVTPKPTEQVATTERK